MVQFEFSKGHNVNLTNQYNEAISKVVMRLTLHTFASKLTQVIRPKNEQFIGLPVMDFSWYGAE